MKKKAKKPATLKELKEKLKYQEELNGDYLAINEHLHTQINELNCKYNESNNKLAEETRSFIKHIELKNKDIATVQNENEALKNSYIKLKDKFNNLEAAYNKVVEYSSNEWNKLNSMYILEQKKKTPLLTKIKLWLKPN